MLLSRVFQLSDTVWVRVQAGPALGHNRDLQRWLPIMTFGRSVERGEEVLTADPATQSLQIITPVLCDVITES